MRTYNKNHPQRFMITSARRRAKNKGIPFSITEEDVVIPKLCPLLGIPLFRNLGGRSAGPNSPSLDRLVPALGYVPGNVIVISNRANAIKQDATLQEIKDLAKNLEKILTERIHMRKGTT